MNGRKIQHAAGALALIVLVVACKNPTTSPEQTGTIQGIVLNDSTGQPIAGASVTTNPGTSAPATGADGRFVLEDVPVGDYTVTAEKNGFETASVTVAVRENDTTEATLNLVPEEDGVSVSAEITNWWNDSTTADSVFANVEFRVRNTGTDSIAQYDVFFEIHSPNGVFQHEEEADGLAVGETDIGDFREFIRDQPADSVIISEVFVPSSNS